MTVPIACAQLACTTFDPCANLDKADQFIRNAARMGARLILLPEFLTSGCTYDARMHDFAEAIGGPTTRWMRQHSSQRKCWIGAGIIEKADGCVYDTFLFTGPSGEVMSYRKRHPFYFEMLYFHRGRSLGIFRTSVGRIGVMMCWDMVQPRLSAEMAGQIDLLLICSAWPDTNQGNIPLYGISGWLSRQPGERPQLLARNLQVPVIYCNMTGPFTTRVPFLGLRYTTAYAGNSSIIDAQARIIAAARDEETIIVGEVEIGSRSLGHAA